MAVDVLTEVILWVSTVLTIGYFPLAVAQLALLLRRIRSTPPIANQPVPGRRVVAVVITNGQNPQSTERVLSAVRSYGLPVDILVLREEGDPFQYSARSIAVPESYSAPKHSLRKMRALHYGSAELHRLGYGAETYILHLDDDSIPSRAYVERIFSMPEAAGQGNIRLREHGRHLFSTLADMARVSDCDAYCSYHNGRGRPNAVHGEGLVVRADVEYEIGWDFGTFGGEDLLMGQEIRSRGISFGFIPEVFYIAPPVCAKDFFRQRRRWIVSTVSAWRRVAALSRTAFAWFVYRYALGWAGFLGVSVLILGIVLQPAIPPLILVLAAFNLLSYLAFYQYGVSRTSPRYRLSMLLLQFPVSVFEFSTLAYALLFPPDRNGFDVIEKA